MDMNQLQCFQLVARYGNVSRAAKELHMTQSGVSKAIARLEAELDMKLFARGTSSIKLNPAGEVFNRFVNNTLFELNNCRIELNQPQAQSLRIATTSDFNMDMLYDSLRSIYPEIEFELMCTTPGELPAVVDNQQADVGFLAIPKQFQNGWEPLRPQKWCVAAHIQHPVLRLGSPVKIQDLAGFDGVFCGSTEVYEIFNHAFSICGISAALRNDRDSNDSFEFLVKKRGYCFIPYDVAYGWYRSRPGLQFGVLELDEALLNRDICMREVDWVSEQEQCTEAVGTLRSLIMQEWGAIDSTVSEMIRNTAKQIAAQ